MTTSAKQGLDVGANQNAVDMANELVAAYAERRTVPTPSSRGTGFALADAYAVEGELARRRVAEGHAAVGLKVGYANKAMWRALKLETLVWGHMYGDTVRMAPSNEATLSIGAMISPKIEPEIVLKVKQPVAGADAAAVLEGVEWIALGFEIIDCPYPNWQFQPMDFVAAYGLHAALIVGEPVAVTPETIPALVDQLASFKLRLSQNGALVEEGSGRNSLRSPALCLGELARVAALSAGDLVSSGTLTASTRMESGDVWKAEVEGIGLPSLTLTISS